MRRKLVEEERSRLEEAVTVFWQAHAKKKGSEQAPRLQNLDWFPTGTHPFGLPLLTDDEIDYLNEKRGDTFAASEYAKKLETFMQPVVYLVGKAIPPA